MPSLYNSTNTFCHDSPIKPSTHTEKNKHEHTQKQWNCAVHWSNDWQILSSNDIKGTSFHLCVCNLWLWAYCWVFTVWGPTVSLQQQSKCHLQLEMTIRKTRSHLAHSGQGWSETAECQSCCSLKELIEILGNAIVDTASLKPRVQEEEGNYIKTRQNCADKSH